MNNQFAKITSPIFSILIADQDVTLRKVLRKKLTDNGYHVVEAADGQEALKKVFENSPNLIIMDAVLQEINGYEVCKILRNDFKANSIYIIYLSEKADTADIVKGLKCGGDDYIKKPFDMDELLARIETGTRIIKDKQMATTDILTGLYNRYYFSNMLKQEIDRAKRYHQTLSLIMMDLDFFKKVNDTYGHDAGDKVLSISAQIFQSNSRSIDTPARWGGEEFILLLPQTTKQGAGLFAERIREMIEDTDFPIAGKITASFGVAELDSDDIELFKKVDAALYKAKETGRNKVVLDS
ncbi:MAG: diguanylate cyclase [Deltaproteobacteria bacterium]|nr:diguanylate cyclase [Deltaproteobacteria bacterium]